MHASCAVRTRPDEYGDFHVAAGASALIGRWPPAKDKGARTHSGNARGRHLRPHHRHTHVHAPPRKSCREVLVPMAMRMPIATCSVGSGWLRARHSQHRSRCHAAPQGNCHRHTHGHVQARAAVPMAMRIATRNAHAPLEVAVCEQGMRSTAAACWNGCGCYVYSGASVVSKAFNWLSSTCTLFNKEAYVYCTWA